MKRVIIIGYKSFIQENLYQHLKKKFIVNKVQFKNLKKYKIENEDVLINCSASKEFFDNKYNKNFDRNLFIANLLKKKKTIFIMLSTRQVYYPKLFVSEKSKIKPINNYAKNCLISEKNCNRKLKKNLLVLRLSNIIGLEIGKKKRHSIMSLIINGLKKKKIIFDNNYNLYKDFLPIKIFCLYIEKILSKNITGIINVGSGIPILVSDFLDKIIANKKVNLLIKMKKNFIDGNFCFNVNKLYRITNIKINKKKLNLHFIYLSKKLEK